MSSLTSKKLSTILKCEKYLKILISTIILAAVRADRQDLKMTAH